MAVEVINPSNNGVVVSKGHLYVQKQQMNTTSTSNKKAKETGRRRRRTKKKKNNKQNNEENGKFVSRSDDDDNNSDIDQQGLDRVEIEYVPEKADLDDELLKDFQRVFEKFSFNSSVGVDSEDKKDDATETAAEKKIDSDDSDDEDMKKKDKGEVSNKKKRLQRRMTIAELKKISSRPDVVEVWDATAADPKLLVFLKSYRNTVPVPRHWSQKSKFLHNKRGIDKIPYQLPENIAATGIEKIRQAYVEKEENKKLGQKQRERMQPKMGKLDIDYAVLHDAFFKTKWKPKMTTHGDLYYEGKEFEIKARERMPGMLSRELKDALGMSEGSPPPWLVSMQRYGPPPSYPQLKIPGLNAPIPPGASFGYAPGCWGRPPVDEFNRPLYGDVFGLQQQEQMNYIDEPIERNWGAVEDYVEEESDEDEVVDENENSENEEVEDDIEKEETNSTTGTETPDVIDLRKQQKEPERPLYQVLEVKEEKIDPGTLLGTTYTYVMKNPPSEDKPSVKRVDHHRGPTTDKVEVTLRPEIVEAEENGDNVLENLDNVLAATYEVAKEEERLRNKKEDFSDMVAENEKKRKRKMQDKDRKSNKKRDFKF